MNFCCDCNSLYTQPGTCNCYAPDGKRAATPLKIVPPEPEWTHPILPYDHFVGSHICGYYNPALSPTWSA